VALLTFHTPNTRLQRTRAVAPRSPLSRKHCVAEGVGFPGNRGTGLAPLESDGFPPLSRGCRVSREEATVKRVVAFSFLLACCGMLLGDSPTPGLVSSKRATLLEELVRLTKAGSSDVTVLAYAKAHRLELPPEVSDDDLLWLRDSGVSEMVVRYMTAIDVRASDAGAQVDVASGSEEAAAHPRAAYSDSENDYDSYRGTHPDRYADNYYDAYPGYDYDDYPTYGYGYYPYPLYFFVDRGGVLTRFRGRDHRFGGHRGFDRDHGFRGHRGSGSRDAWRERGFSVHRGRSIVVGPRGSGRATFARGGFGGGFPPGFRGPRGGVGGDRGFSHPGFSGGPHTGGGFSSSPRVATGSPGGRGRR
jgi:hypothetical protein